MNLWRLNPLRSNTPHQQLLLLTHHYHSPTNKPISTTTHIEEQAEQTKAILSLLRSPNFSPTPTTYSNLLSQCLSTSQPLTFASQIHARLAKSGLTKHATTHTLLTRLYLQLNLPDHVRDLLDEIPHLEHLVSAYARAGLARESALAFKNMRSAGIECDVFTFPSVLKACSTSLDYVTLGTQIHAVVVFTGFESDVYVANTLAVAYAKWGMLSHSRRLFDAIPDRNVVSWNVLLNGYVRNDRCGEALRLFGEMVLSGTKPDEFSLSTALNACTGAEDLHRGRLVHGILVRMGHAGDLFTSNALVDMYAKLGDMGAACAAFEGIGLPDVVSWNALIAGCVLHGRHARALELVEEMKRAGTKPNIFTHSSVLKACAEAEALDLGRQIHSSLIKTGSDHDPFVSVGLVDMYAKCAIMEDARRAFDSIRDRSLIAWNALISGYSQNGHDEEALALFSSMRGEGFSATFNRTALLAVLKSSSAVQSVVLSRQLHALALKAGLHCDDHVVNSLIDAYGKCGFIEDARMVFDENPFGDIVAFTSMITVYAQFGWGEEALKLYVNMLKGGHEPDGFACSSALNACTTLSAYEQGKQIHARILKSGFIHDIFAGNALVNMYAKCGSVEDAGVAFSEIPERGVVSWSAMIGGLAQHGRGEEALEVFREMLEEEVAPNHITLTSVLCACNHAGLVSEAEEFFDTMERRFAIERTGEHYACMIDVLGRAGRLDEAVRLVETMPFEANSAVWGALLGAARIHKDPALANQAAERLLSLEPEKSGTHVLLANVYASAGMWGDVARVRRAMRECGVKKEPGMSWVEAKDEVHAFVVGDNSHPRAPEIYAKLEELGRSIVELGYEPMVEIDLHNVGRTIRRRCLRSIASGLLWPLGSLVHRKGCRFGSRRI
ncbi:Pentatricopeptide repeat-containing protein [Acorus calamus]|uniref:Pentatricopeptide repeat-containing protein n=1 Tax=Acorus calamus TaxID=4465 RepID=A0AAV9EYN6_ACOCL|nr:Pentatricopeptide repeat-containing protein [Acorus calamus]